MAKTKRAVDGFTSLRRIMDAGGPMAAATGKRSFTASDSGNLFAGWVTQNVPTNTLLRQELRKIRARSNDLARNNDYFREFLRLLKVNVVGPKGLRLQARGVNRDGRPDTEGNQIVERAWAQWGKPGNCTVDGRGGLVDVFNQAIDSTARNGEVIIRIVRGYKHNAFRYGVQLIQPDLLDETLNQELRNGRQIRMGIEMDQWFRPLAYHFLTSHPNGDTWTLKGKRYVRIPADQIIHAFIPVDEEQWRGLPWGVSAFTRLKMASGYEEAELVAARTAASKMGFYKRLDDDHAEDDDVAVVQHVSPGQLEMLPANVDFESFDPQHPTTQFRDFMKGVLRGASAGLGISYNVLAKDLEGVNYSSLRQGALEDRDAWQALQHWLIDHVCQPLFEDWLNWSLATGAPALRPLSVRAYEKFAEPTWQPRGWSWVDPQKEVTAKEKELSLGMTSLTRVAASRGEDLEEIFRERQRERELAEQYGVDLTPAGPAAPGATPTEGAADGPGDD